MALVAVALGAALIGTVGIGVKLFLEKRQSAAVVPAPPIPVPVPGSGSGSAPKNPAQPNPAPPNPAPPKKPSPDSTDSPKPADPKPSTSGHVGALVVAIRTMPEGARVIIDDGKFSPCTSPCLVELPNGRHTATIILDPYKTENRIFNVPQDASVSVNLEHRKGSLEVTSTPPGAAISIDGAEIPMKTPALVHLILGKHTISISLPGKTTSTQTIEIRSETSSRIDANWAN